jgi:GNAT superfamily N-acetyltransferase
VELDIRRMRAGEAEACEQVLRALPEWFGIEQSILDYRQDVEALETWVVTVAGALGGFVTLRAHNPHSAEIQVLAVLRELHGRGVGSALVAHAEALLAARGVEYLQVKTLGPSRLDPNYDRTRRFYAARGFRALEEHRLWGDVNPCLVLVKRLAES